MDSQKASNWFQLLTTVAVLAGLTLVVFELRQAKELTWGFFRKAGER